MCAVINQVALQSIVVVLSKTEACWVLSASCTCLLVFFLPVVVALVARRAAHGTVRGVNVVELLSRSVRRLLAELAVELAACERRCFPHQKRQQAGRAAGAAELKHLMRNWNDAMTQHDLDARERKGGAWFMTFSETKKLKWMPISLFECSKNWNSPNHRVHVRSVFNNYDRLDAGSRFVARKAELDALVV